MPITVHVYMCMPTHRQLRSTRQYPVATALQPPTVFDSCEVLAAHHTVTPGGTGVRQAAHAGAVLSITYSGVQGGSGECVEGRGKGRTIILRLPCITTTFAQ
jgi:hypothetical protein